MALIFNCITLIITLLLPFMFNYKPTNFKVYLNLTLFVTTFVLKEHSFYLFCLDKIVPILPSIDAKYEGCFQFWPNLKHKFVICIQWFINIEHNSCKINILLNLLKNSMITTLETL